MTRGSLLATPESRVAITRKESQLRHYEIVFLIHPDQSEQVPAMVEKYQGMVTESGGQVHRLEDWGRRQLSHTINKIHKAHYVLMNIECEQPVLDEIQSAFKFNDAVLRHLVIRREEAVSVASPLARTEEEMAEKEARQNAADKAADVAAETAAAEPAAATETAEPATDDAPAPAEDAAAPESEESADADDNSGDDEPKQAAG